jgi:hypothetical protein
VAVDAVLPTLVVLALWVLTDVAGLGMHCVPAVMSAPAAGAVLLGAVLALQVLTATDAVPLVLVGVGAVLVLWVSTAMDVMPLVLVGVMLVLVGAVLAQRELPAMAGDGEC